MHLTILLLAVDGGRELFFSRVDGPEDPAEPPAPVGFWARMEARLHRFKRRWTESESSAARTTRRVWHWLHRRTHPDEVLYARLRSADRIVLDYPPTLDPPAVHDRWWAFLRRGRLRHWPWFGVNLLIAPLTIVLAPLPGPNLIGYWFVYRAVHHLLILRGLGRVRAGRVAVVLQAEAALERVIVDVGQASRVASDLGADLDELIEFLERQHVRLDRPQAPAEGTSDEH